MEERAFVKYNFEFTEGSSEKLTKKSFFFTWKITNINSLLIVPIYLQATGVCAKTIQPWTNIRQQDKTWAEFSTLDLGVHHLHHAILPEKQNCPNLKWKTRPKQLLGFLPFAFNTPIRVY